MFICNHCPYVKSIRERIVRDTRELQQYGINSIAIMSNDPAEYAEDSFDNMKLAAQQYGYPFPYVWDETQQVARITARSAPGFLRLQCGPRIAVPRPSGCLAQGGGSDAPRDLFNAMKQVAQTGKGPQEQIASMGCSIKWRHES